MGVVVHHPCAPRITVAVADDQPVMREGLSRLIDDECDLASAGSAATAAELRALVSRQAPHVLVTELTFRDADGLGLLKDLAALAPALRIVVFTSEPAKVYAVRCFSAGAQAYVMKHEPVTTLFRAIRDTAAAGIAIASRSTGSMLGDHTRQRDTTAAAGLAAPLTNRELEVFRLVALALPTRAIAAKLGVSVKTVETHRENIKNKLDLHSHGELVARAALWLRENNQG